MLNPRKTADLTPLKRMDGDPVFDEPWQAQVLAMADTLVSQGIIAPTAWSERLGAELENAQSTGAPDNIDTYYKAALRALEHLLERYGGISANAVSTRRDGWEQAYLATPHGQPVELKE